MAHMTSRITFLVARRLLHRVRKRQACEAAATRSRARRLQEHKAKLVVAKLDRLSAQCAVLADAD